MSGWNNQETAEKYEAYAQTHSMYRDTSHDLVRLADIQHNMSVIDLCCGTGITSEAVMKKISKNRASLFCGFILCDIGCRSQKIDSSKY